MTAWDNASYRTYLPVHPTSKNRPPLYLCVERKPKNGSIQLTDGLGLSSWSSLVSLVLLRQSIEHDFFTDFFPVNGRILHPAPARTYSELRHYNRSEFEDLVHHLTLLPAGTGTASSEIIDTPLYSYTKLAKCRSSDHNYDNRDRH
jgi:hypothetical protein